ncbi:cdc42 effector protein 4-like isoform X2 [Lethenteron reissneri]|nr:cdc42 effector protein 4-like isoform X2 [Lethenteron reissneri]
MPLLRQLLPGSPSRRHGSRGELRAEMISAPLRDFRHTMHVGRGGAAFGDTAFLSGGTTATATAATATTSSPPTPPPASRRPSPHNLLLLLPWGRVRRSNSGQQQQQQQQQQLQQGGQLGEIPPAGQSPIIKNALSLPALTGPRFTLGSSGSRSATATPVRVTPAAGGQARGPPKEDEEDGDEEEEEVDGPGGLGSPSARRRAAFPHTDSVLSFHVDLGPSMLGDVLGVMDVVDEAQGGAGPARSSVLEPPPPPHGAEDLADGDDVDDGDGDVDGVLDGAETRGAAERAGPKGGQSRLGGSHEGGQERAVAAPGEAVSVGAVAGAGQETLQGAAEKVDTENGERAADRAGDGSSEGAVAGQDVREGAGQEETLEGAGQETRDGAMLGALGSEGQESSQGAAGRAGQG